MIQLGQTFISKLPKKSKAPGTNATFWRNRKFIDVGGILLSHLEYQSGQEEHDLWYSTNTLPTRPWSAISLPSSFIHLTGHTMSKLMPSTSIPDAPILTWIPGIFSSWSPRLFKCYCDYLKELLKRHPELFPNFPNSPWASATINFGPKMVCFKHRDFNNLPFGWCAITSLGDFDPTLGGHLILWELKLVITFPPGSTILIPTLGSHLYSPIRWQEMIMSHR